MCWFAQFLFFVLPALCSVFFLGYRLKFLRLSLWMSLAWSEPANIAAHPPDLHFIRPWNLLGVVIAGILAAVILVRRTNGLVRILVGLSLATLAEDALSATDRMPFGAVRLTSTLEMLICVVAICAGLWWMVSGWRLSNYWRRVESLMAAFVFPVTGWRLLRAVFRFGFWGPMRTADFLPLVAAVLAVLIVSWPGSRAPAEGVESGWRATA